MFSGGVSRTGVFLTINEGTAEHAVIKVTKEVKRKSSVRRSKSSPTVATYHTMNYVFINAQ